MDNMGFRPKFYNCTIDGIKGIKDKNLFVLRCGDETMPIQVDQPSELILSRMKEIVDGKRDKLYLTRGMRDIDISYLGNNKWQLFDEFDIYEFEYDLEGVEITEEDIAEINQLSDRVR